MRLSQPKSPEEDPLLCKMDLPLRGLFYPLGFAVEILTNSPAVLDAAGESWAHLSQRQSNPILRIRIGVTDGGPIECPAAPVVRAHQKLLTIVADADHQAVSNLATGVGFAWLRQATLDHRSYVRYHFIEALALILISTSYATAIHAACVSRHGHGLMLCGESGAGKSSLAYACARAGWTYTSDDACYLLRNSDKPRVVGNSHQLRFRPSATDLFPELSGRSLTPRAEGKPSIEVPTSELPGLIASDEAAVHSIVFLDRRPSAVAELTPLSRKLSIHRFHQALSPFKETQRLQRALMRSLASVKVYELHYRDLHHAVSRLEDLTLHACEL